MKVIILCGGQGTRLREETEHKPKPMVEIGGKPILWHIMKLYSHYGHKDFILALGYKGDVIRRYFLDYSYFSGDFTVNLGSQGDIQLLSRHEESDWNVTLVETGQDSMTGYRVKLCGQHIAEDDFMMTYGDAVGDIDIDALVDFHRKRNTTATVTGVFPPSRFGDLAIADDLVTEFKEKPKDHSLEHPINGGFFVFKKELFSIIPDDPACDLEGAPLQDLASERNLSVYRHKGFWQCMDTYRDCLLLNRLWNENPRWKVWDTPESKRLTS